MNDTTTRHATAFGFAAIVTLAMLGGVDSLATRPAGEMQLARQQPAATQVVVVESRRAAKS